VGTVAGDIARVVADLRRRPPAQEQARDPLPVIRSRDLALLASNYGPPYGAAELNLGRVLDADFRSYRDELVISTKAGHDTWPGPYGNWGSRKYLLTSLEQSLRRMRLEYVDIFYSDRVDPETPLEETLGALDTAVRQGKALRRHQLVFRRTYRRNGPHPA
jgi:hypothetical protein